MFFFKLGSYFWLFLNKLMNSFILNVKSTMNDSITNILNCFKSSNKFVVNLCLCVLNCQGRQVYYLWCYVVTPSLINVCNTIIANPFSGLPGKCLRIGLERKERNI